jgi:uncharacterized protein
MRDDFIGPQAPPPIVIASGLSETLLAPAPIPPEWIMEGTPIARNKLMARSSDGNSFAVVWSCTAGVFNWSYAFDETLHIISGEVFVTDKKGEEHHLRPGDMAFFPAGSRSLWRVPSEIRKFAVCRHVLPWPLAIASRAWRNFRRPLIDRSRRGWNGGQLA